MNMLRGNRTRRPVPQSLQPCCSDLLSQTAREEIMLIHVPIFFTFFLNGEETYKETMMEQIEIGSHMNVTLFS
jgi:hypothetical protein